MENRTQLPKKVARTQAMAVGMGWFSIGLGTMELLFAGPLARALGMRGSAGMIRLYGAREIATGIGLLSAKDREPWLWGRVAGDGLDIVTLAANVDDNPKVANVALALGAVAGATAIDFVTAEGLAAQRVKAKKRASYDYSDRSGFPNGLAAARGAAMLPAAPKRH